MKSKIVAKERAIQLVEKEQRLEQERKEKIYYEELWENDRQKKLQKEISERENMQKRTLETLKTIQQQIQGFREQALRHEELKKQETILMVAFLFNLAKRSANASIRGPKNKRKKETGTTCSSIRT
jgi:hypothetical protein